MIVSSEKKMGRAYKTKMIKSEAWVKKELLSEPLRGLTSKNALSKIEECEEHIRGCNYEISQIEIRKKHGSNENS